MSMTYDHIKGAVGYSEDQIRDVLAQLDEQRYINIVFLQSADA